MMSVSFLTESHLVAEQKFTPAQQPKPRVEAAPVVAQAQSLSGLTDQQAQEFHEQFKVTYTAFVALAAVAHLFVLAVKPWF